jgi:hypothetical protein
MFMCAQEPERPLSGKYEMFESQMGAQVIFVASGWKEGKEPFSSV